MPDGDLKRIYLAEWGEDNRLEVSHKGGDKTGVINQLELLAASLRRTWQVQAVEPAAFDGSRTPGRRSSRSAEPVPVGAATDGAGT